MNEVKKMNEINRSNSNDDLTNRSMNNQIGSKMNYKINNKRVKKSNKKKK